MCYTVLYYTILCCNMIYYDILQYGIANLQLTCQGGCIGYLHKENDKNKQKNKKKYFHK